MSWQETLVQQLINGLSLGMVYALIALGYTMVYGIIQLINFAHGEVFMVGAYLGLSVLLALGISSPPAGVFLVLASFLIFAVPLAGCGLLGVAIEKAAYRPLRHSPRLAPLITAIGMSFFLQNAVMLIYGPAHRGFPPLFQVKQYTLFGSAVITNIQILIFTVSIFLMIFLHTFVQWTRLGKALRATSQDLKAASLMGINVDGIISLCFLLGSSLGAAGGVMYGMYYGRISFFDGYLVGIKAFTAAVLGGIGNIPGAMLGGILLGLTEGLGAGYLSSQWKDAYAFFILVLLLLFKPTGLLGERLSSRS